MTPRERFAAALRREPLKGNAPTFELVFFLTMEAFGKIHPSQRHYGQWNQMSESERRLHREEVARLFIQTAQHYEHDAIFVHPPVGGEEELFRLLDLIRELSDKDYFLMIHGDPTYGIPDGDSMMPFTMWMYEHMDEAKEEAAKRVANSLEAAERLAKHGALDGFALCSDYCLNTGPFLSPDMFGEMVTPYLAEVLKGYRDLGFLSIKHTDGNIMPIIDQLVEAGPDALHSLDPQGGVDIAEVKARYGSQVALCGNVNCGLIQTGTEEEVAESARYAIRHGMPGGGYVFCTSNCAYTGMPLERYELIWRIWKEEAVYA
jgi:uroporphyrinogen decarboxylase